MWWPSHFAPELSVQVDVVVWARVSRAWPVDVVCERNGMSWEVGADSCSEDYT